MADNFDKDFDAAWDNEFEKAYQEDEKKRGKEKLGRFQTKVKESPEFKAAQMAQDSSLTQSVASGVKSGMGALGGGREALAGDSGQAGSAIGRLQTEGLNADTGGDLFKAYLNMVGPGMLMPVSPMTVKPLVTSLLGNSSNKQAAEEESQLASNETAHNPGVALATELTSQAALGGLDVPNVPKPKFPTVGKIPAAMEALKEAEPRIGKFINTYRKLRPPSPKSYANIPDMPTRSIGKGANYQAEATQSLVPELEPKGVSPVPQDTGIIPDMPPPPDYPGGDVFRYSPPAEVPMGPEAEGPVFQDTDPFANKIQQVEDMARQLQEEMAARGPSKNSDIPLSLRKNMGRRSGTKLVPDLPSDTIKRPNPMENLNLPHDTNIGQAAPESSSLFKQPSVMSYPEHLDTKDFRPPIKAPEKSFVPEDNSVPQFVRDIQGSPDKPTFGSQGRPDDELNIQWLEQQINANHSDKALNMLKERFGQDYVDYLMNEISKEM